jgi:hypothetical protein
MSYQPDPLPRRQSEYVDDRATQPMVVAPAAPVIEHVVVEQPSPIVHRRVASSYGQRFAFDSVIVGIIGLALTIVGLIAVTRAGVDGPMSQPVVKVLGFTHTATLGALETGIGVCLLICAAITSRGGAAFFGVVLGVGAIVGAVQTNSFRHSLALQSGFAWLVVIAAAIIVIVSLVLPRMSTLTTRVDAY